MSALPAAVPPATPDPTTAPPRSEPPARPSAGADAGPRAVATPPATDPAARAWSAAVDVDRLLGTAAPLVPQLAVRVVRQVAGRFHLVPAEEVPNADAYAPGAVRPLVSACSVHPAGDRLLESILGLGVRVKVPAHEGPSMFLVVDGTMMVVHERLDRTAPLPDPQAAWAHTAAHAGFHAWPCFREFCQQSIARMDLPRIMLPPLTPGDLGGFALEWLQRQPAAVGAAPGRNGIT